MVVYVIRTTFVLLVYYKRHAEACDFQIDLKLESSSSKDIMVSWNWFPVIL